MSTLGTSSQSVIFKKRRLQGACDICRQKKVRCDSAEMPLNRCSNCIAFNSQCTRNATKKRSARSARNFDSTSRNETVLPLQPNGCTQARSGMSLGQGIDESQTPIHPLIQNIMSSSKPLELTIQHSLLALSQHIHKLEQELAILKQSINSTFADPSFSRTNTSSVGLCDPSLDVSVASDDVELAEHLKRMTITSFHKRHFGASSTMSLLGTAIEIGKKSKSTQAVIDSLVENHRAEFWSVHPWEGMDQNYAPVYEFPDQDLFRHLINLYFAHVVIHFPLLHRPTFERLLADNVHLTNHLFGATVLAVCAVASRYSDDPRVLLEDDNSRHSSGWKWYRQIQHFRKSFAQPPSLFELQTICLSLLYLHGTSQPEACWVMAGIGIRYAQEVGAHRRRSTSVPSVENELWKRAFWILICIDAIICSFLGRPRATISDDFDLDLPLDCDDEYWENDDPSLAFKQPPGQPSLVASFISYLKLLEILEYAQLTLYSVKKFKKARGRSWVQNDEQVVTDLDSELNKWLDSVPEYLRWPSSQENHVFFEQSAMLHVSYHHIRILVHRPFIPSPTRSSPLPFPSLAICTNAARSCVHIMKAQSKKRFLPFPQIQFALFTSGIILLLNYWTGIKMSRVPRDPSEDVKSVQDCLDVLHTLEGRWLAAGRLCDVIRELSSIGDTPLFGPYEQSALNRKRAGDKADLHPLPAPPQVFQPHGSSTLDLGPQPTQWDANLPSSFHPMNVNFGNFGHGPMNVSFGADNSMYQCSSSLSPENAFNGAPGFYEYGLFSTAPSFPVGVDLLGEDSSPLYIDVQNLQRWINHPMVIDGDTSEDIGINDWANEHPQVEQTISALLTRSMGSYSSS
ncbi:Cutinase transcription factor 1 alpha [Hypsizygus marmoreus]|uniref:Cutinase transcription factor 1 alpha n=1 Tax=Hypsizygus marmoreus TaxID=39966 RepID=A0A369JTS1_HYPMA|nr:Cutinase transcription factor 1 alpha [Hypsizygus marmoreus]